MDASSAQVLLQEDSFLLPSVRGEEVRDHPCSPAPHTHTPSGLRLPQTSLEAPDPVQPPLVPVIPLVSATQAQSQRELPFAHFRITWQSSSGRRVRAGGRIVLRKRPELEIRKTGSGHCSATIQGPDPVQSPHLLGIRVLI